MAAVSIRPYVVATDVAWAYTLWQATLGAGWPVSRETFRQMTVASDVYQPGDHWVAEIDHEVIGFVGTQVRHVPGAGAPTGELMLIMVEPSRQRQGVGRALLQHALAAVEQRGVTQVQLGGGGICYFWPGVPVDLPGAWSFFQACGWTEVERSFDLVRDLSDYVTPAGIHERTRREQVAIETAKPADAPAVLAFERRHFPRWLHIYERAVANEAQEDVVVAWDAGGAVVGTTLVMSPRSRWRCEPFKWERLLGENTGGVGPLGVREEQRGRGIGLALAARVTELLQERGVKTSYIGWTWLVDWYGRLGYRVWREYHMSWTPR